MKEIRDFAKTLAKFHKLTRSMNIKGGTPGNYKDIKRLINDFYKKRAKFPNKIQKILEYMNQEINKLQIPKKEYLTGYYSEFNPGHVLFKNNKVKYVIDWEIGKEEAFFDYGSSMTACFNKDGTKLSIKKIKEFIKSYSNERLLTNWEKEHLFDSFKFGVLKYGIWGFIDLKTGKMVKSTNKIDQDELNKIKYLMSINKDYFNKIIK